MRNGLVILLFCLAATFHPGLCTGQELADGDSVQPGRLSETELETLTDALTETGLARDAIPAINQPQFLSVEDASLVLDRWERVFIWEAPDGPRIYPGSIMVWHQIVNDTLGEGDDARRVSITYSPLTGTVAGFFGAVDRFRTTFGDTGLLINANMVMYDRSTNSFWPQLLARAIDGRLTNERLEMFPVLWSTWEQAREVFPDARVLSRDTGYRRAYNRDPYGAYHREGSYYTNDNVHHPVTRLDTRLRPKTRVLGLMQGSARAAVLRSSVEAAGAISFDFGMEPLVAVYDPALGAVRIFHREVDGEIRDFTMNGDVLEETGTGRQWARNGERVTGRQADGARSLRQVPFMESMWFAWAAFHPTSTIIR